MRQIIKHASSAAGPSTDAPPPQPVTMTYFSHVDPDRHSTFNKNVDLRSPSHPSINSPNGMLTLKLKQPNPNTLSVSHLGPHDIGTWLPACLGQR